MAHDVSETNVNPRKREKLCQRKPTDKYTSQGIRMNISGSSQIMQMDQVSPGTRATSIGTS